MQRPEVPAWSLRVDVSELLHVALYVRDVAAIELPPWRATPPPLMDRLPTHSLILPPASRRSTGLEWLRWWDSIVTSEIDAYSRLTSAGSGRGGRQETETASQEEQHKYAAAESPQFSDPVVRRTVHELVQEGHRWWNENHRTRAQWGMDRELLDRVVKEASSRLGGCEVRLRSMVEVVLVEGEWWHRPAEQALLCSVSLTNNFDGFGSLLRKFLSSARSDMASQVV